MKLSKEKLLIILYFIGTLDKLESSDLISYWFAPKTDNVNATIQDHSQVHDATESDAGEEEEEIDFFNYETSGDTAVKNIGFWAQTGLQNLGSWTNNLVQDYLKRPAIEIPIAEMVNYNNEMDHHHPQIVVAEPFKDLEMDHNHNLATEIKNSNELCEEDLEAELASIVPVEPIKNLEETTTTFITPQPTDQSDERQQEQGPTENEVDFGTIYEDNDEYKDAELFPYLGRTTNKDADDLKYDQIYEDSKEYKDKVLFPDYSDSDSDAVPNEDEELEYSQVYEYDKDKIFFPDHSDSELDAMEKKDILDLQYDQIYAEPEKVIEGENAIRGENLKILDKIEDAAMIEPVELLPEEQEAIKKEDLQEKDTEVEVESEKVEIAPIIEEKVEKAAPEKVKVVNPGPRQTNNLKPMVSNPTRTGPSKGIKFPTLSGSNFINFENNANVSAKSFMANPLFSVKKPTVSVTPPVLPPQLDVVKLRKIYADMLMNSKLSSSSYNSPNTAPKTALRKAVTPSSILDFFGKIKVTNSLDFAQLMNQLKVEFEHELDTNIKASKKKRSKIWVENSWADLCRPEYKGIAEGIISEKNKLAPFTMKKMPFLLPKDKFEAEILDGWLVKGLIILYPTLGDSIPAKLTKDDVVSLILFALIFTDKITSETKPIIKLIMSDLARYNEQYPLSSFKNIDSTDPNVRSDLFAELVKIVNEKHLPYTFEAINISVSVTD